MYIKKWGRNHKILTKYFVGEQYCLKLKQSDRRGFSARSTGALDTKSLPTRSFKSRHHQERHSSSCIRFGEFESLNFSIGLVPQDIALFHALYRTSLKGRRDLISTMFNTEGTIEHIDGSYTSRVSEIFNVILKSLGIGLEFVDDEDTVKSFNNSVKRHHKIGGIDYLCTDYEAFLLQRASDIRQEILLENPVITTRELEKKIEEVLKTRKFINGPINEELEGYEVSLKKELDETFEQIKAEKMRKESEEIAETLTEITEKK